MIWLLLWLFTKHLLVDFFWQFPYMYQNKGAYGHGGGIVHAIYHALGTWLILLIYSQPLDERLWVVNLLSILDGIIHYHIDWFKVNICKKKDWGMTTHEEYWWALGVDQYLHTLTYFLLAYLWFR